MDNPYANAGLKPEAALAAAERFFELLKSFGVPAGGSAPNWSSLAAPLAGQFEQWLRLSQATGPWFATPGAAWPGAAAAFTAPGFNPAAFTPAAATAFSPLPLGPSAVSSGELQRVWELWGRLAQLQAQLAAHWSEIANTAARCFVTRLGAAAGAPATPEQALKLYEVWVDCAEEAYAATVHKEDFARLQAELANTSATLLVEQRKHAEALVRAFGLPTRNELDTLYGQLKDLRRQLAELAAPGRSSREHPSRRAPPADTANRARKRPAAPPARARRARTRTRTPTRGPRA
jgi:Poly(R)-hydroxyalkanoic acid synthase subunit (PHA_synth_III_E)